MDRDAKAISRVVAQLLQRRIGMNSDSPPTNIPITLCNVEVWTSCPQRTPLCCEQGIKGEIRSQMADLALTRAGSELVNSLVESINCVSLSAYRQAVGEELFKCIYEGILDP